MMFGARCCIHRLTMHMHVPFQIPQANLRYNKFWFTLGVGKKLQKKREELIDKQQNSSKMVIVLRSIPRIEKKKHLEREKALKCLNTFL